MRFRRTKALLTNFTFLTLFAITISALAFAGDKKSSSAPAPAPAARPAPQQQRAAPQQQRQAPQQQRQTPQQLQNRLGQTPAHPSQQTPAQKTAPTNPRLYVAHPGDQPKAIAGGRTEIHSTNGRVVTTNAHGEVQRIEVPRGLAGGNKMVISRGPGGRRMVQTGRPGARVVSFGAGRGYVEHALRPGYISRTYVVNGHSYAHVYRESAYHGTAYHQYVPGAYYGARFYGWALSPWGSSIRYGWSGLATPAPWLHQYPGYFTPDETYASADSWLTDYVVGENLRAGYENQVASNEDPTTAAGGPAMPGTGFTPEMKSLIADEVRQQLAAERAIAALPTPTLDAQASTPPDQTPLALKQKFFVVSSNLDITTVGGQACTLTPGDMIQRRGSDVSNDGTVAVEVVRSKPAGCPNDSATTVQFADLQEMSNQFREQIDSGLKKLADGQVKGLPGAPAANARIAANGTADPLPDASTQLAAQDADASKLEAQLRQGGF